MKAILQILGVGACITLTYGFSDNAVAASRAAAVMATPAVKSARALHPVVALAGCVQQAQFSNPFGSGACKYVTVKGVNFSVAVPSETPLSEIPELKSIPPNLMPQPISPNTVVSATALTIDGPSWNCLGAEVKVTGSVVVHYVTTAKTCPAK
jgi:hypothetical protein